MRTRFLLLVCFIVKMVSRSNSFVTASFIKLHIFSKVSIGEPNSFSSTQGSRCTIVRRFPGKEYPLDIQTSLKDENTKNKHAIALEVSESALLAALVGMSANLYNVIIAFHTNQLYSQVSYS